MARSFALLAVPVEPSQLPLRHVVPVPELAVPATVTTAGGIGHFSHGALAE